MGDEQWRDLTEAESSLVEDWLTVWNETTGDEAELLPGPRARDTCTCSCPSFEVRRLSIDLRRVPGGSLSVGGIAWLGETRAIGSLTVLHGEPGGLHFDISWLDPISPAPGLADLTFTIDGREPGAEPPT